jgi:hypothetical protein
VCRNKSRFSATDRAHLVLTLVVDVSLAGAYRTQGVRVIGCASPCKVKWTVESSIRGYVSQLISAEAFTFQYCGSPAAELAPTRVRPRLPLYSSRKLRCNLHTSASTLHAEQLTLNQRVQGSSPCAPTNKIRGFRPDKMTDQRLRRLAGVIPGVTVRPATVRPGDMQRLGRKLIALGHHIRTLQRIIRRELSADRAARSNVDNDDFACWKVLGISI